MTPRNALLAIHLGALMFGLSGVLGKLAESSALIITFGRALFAVLALLLVAQLLRPSGATPNWRQRGGLALGGLLLGAHWLTFFIAVKIAGVGIATLGFASFPAFTVLLEGLLFRERTRAIEFAMVGLVCAGLLLVAPAFDLSSGPTAGLLYGVLSGCCSRSCRCSTVPSPAASIRFARRSGRTWRSSQPCCHSAGRRYPRYPRRTGSGWLCSACSAPDSRTACSSLACGS